MNKRMHLINKVKSFEEKYFNEDQKTIAIKILENAPENEVQAYADFVFMKRRTGFGFDYSPEIAKGRLITLREDIKRRINVGNEVEDDENKLIIGDNYNALKSLLVTHKNKIDIIYIDPPYNTEAAKKDGNQSSKNGQSSKFVYKDKFGRGGWLNMMKARLTLAKDLLTNEGIIFVSIDDSEQAYLRILMDEIFGESNFVNQLIWVSNKAGRQISNAAFAKTYEYILMYSKKQIKNYVNARLEKKLAQKIMPSIYEPKKINFLKDKKGLFVVQHELHNLNIKSFNIENRKNLFFPIYTNGSDISIKKIDHYIKLLPPKNSTGVQGVWRWSKDKIALEKDDLYVKKHNNGFKIFTKIRDSKYIPKDIILSSKFTTKSGSNELTNLNIEGFSFPKPTSLIIFLITLFSKKDSISLDFFAGSGTTAHAIMELNKEDGGNRKFILCTNNENKIAHNVTYERLHRIIKGKGTNNESDFKWIKDNKPYPHAKLRVINIDDQINIQIGQKISDKVYQDCQNGLKLLDQNYKKMDINLYYDLAALNPLKNEDDKY